MDKNKLAREHAKNVEPENKGSYADFLAGFDAAESIANAKIQELEERMSHMVLKTPNLPEYIAELQQRVKELEKSESQLISERDFREDQINKIADLLGDFREWTSHNDRGENCLESIEVLQTKITELEQQLKKAEEVIEFYSKEDNFHVNCLILDEYDQGDFQIICEDMNGKSEETDDFTQRARQYLKSRGE